MECSRCRHYYPFLVDELLYPLKVIQHIFQAPMASFQPYSPFPSTVFFSSIFSCEKEVYNVHKLQWPLCNPVILSLLLSFFLPYFPAERKCTVYTLLLYDHTYVTYYTWMVRLYSLELEHETYFSLLSRDFMLIPPEG